VWYYGGLEVWASTYVVELAVCPAMNFYMLNLKCVDIERVRQRSYQVHLLKVAACRSVYIIKY
jgi:hypothetical protein